MSTARKNGPRVHLRQPPPSQLYRTSPSLAQLLPQCQRFSSPQLPHSQRGLRFPALWSSIRRRIPHLPISDQYMVLTNAFDAMTEYQLSRESPNIIHMSVRPVEMMEEEEGTKAKSTGSGGRTREGGGCCVIL